MKKLISRLLHIYADREEYAAESFSQEGEDMVLRKLLGDKPKGFYVDIGAHHPKRFSNTFYFYKKGWRGLNVDADSDLIKNFVLARPRDINVSCAVGKEHKKLTFYVFNDQAISTFDKRLADERAKIKGYNIVDQRKIPVLPLKTILGEYIPDQQEIDFMNVDVEGKDLEVLQTNDWSKYRPRFLLVECRKVNFLTDLKKDPIARLLSSHNYVPVAKSYNTIFFADKDNYENK
ncbi:SAM-dependent methyltransferase [Candidatus Saccharibacteria bacterium]|nr:SAM-dependent methyltransferase [Candidatus Saccharibacteria bacterium]